MSQLLHSIYEIKSKYMWTSCITNILTYLPPQTGVAILCTQQQNYRNDISQKLSPWMIEALMAWRRLSGSHSNSSLRLQVPVCCWLPGHVFESFSGFLIDPLLSPSRHGMCQNIEWGTLDVVLCEACSASAIYDDVSKDFLSSISPSTWVRLPFLRRQTFYLIPFEY